MSLSPIVLFTFNRPDHTLRTLSSLMENDFAEESELFIYSDGAGNRLSVEEAGKVAEVRELIRKKKWCKYVHVIESANNKGLSNSIISGVTEVFEQYGKVIVLEDDMVSSKYFLRFMNDALNMYEQNEEVACVSGYVYPLRKKLPETFFIKGADCWGWGTWKRAWNLFQPDGKMLLTELTGKQLTGEFDFGNTYPYTQMLADQIEGKNDSWAIRWYASAFLKNKLTLYPTTSFIHNTGNDLSGFHSSSSSKYDVVLADAPLPVKTIPLEENRRAKKIMGEYFRTINKRKSIQTVIFERTNTFLKKIVKGT